MRLLFTHPRDPSLRGIPPRGGGDYLLELEKLLTTAKESVEVICPFIDKTGAEVLAAAFNRGAGAVRWEVFTRKAPNELVRIARDSGWGLYEYVGTPGADERRGFHCKLFIADGDRAIMGSANLFYENLVENLEVGILLEDPRDVRPLLAVPRSLKAASRRRC